MIGLGSIGKRHVKNLTSALAGRQIEYRIDALRSSKAILPEDVWRIISEQFYSYEELPDDYDVIFVTNPTSLHYEVIQKTVSKTKHMFIEKPIFCSLDCDLSKLPLKKEGVYYVACPLRHKSIMWHVKQEILPKEKIIAARSMSSSYLPAWRKGTDYRKAYSASKEMGGGVSRDLIHEWDYLLDLFGAPQEVRHMQGRVSDLEIDSEDLSVYIAKYPQMILEVHLDYIGQKTERFLQLFTNEKRIDVDFIRDEIHEYAGDKLINTRQFPAEDFYRNEMEYFLDCVTKGEGNVNTVENACSALKIALTEE